MALPSRLAAGPAGGRLTALDSFRGLVMVLMALDHASYFVAGVHQSELWSRPLPQYDAVLPFLTRLVSHLCAPAFFLLMGIGMVFFTATRDKAGWSRRRIGLHLALRGALLVCLQFLVENPAWSIHDAGALRFAPYFGVLYGLGAAMFVWSPLLRLPSPLVAAISLVVIAASEFLVPRLAQGVGDGSLWLGMLLVPGKAGWAYVLYPLVPWSGVVGLGICLGRMLRRDVGRVRRWLFAGAIAALTAFLALRLAGVGDFHPPASHAWISLLNVTKYPPSLDFMLLTLGMDALLLSVFLHLGQRTGARGRGLTVFGRTPLFFYVIHLYVYALIGLALPRPTTLAGMYPYWLLGLAGLYPLCRLYDRFKVSRPAASVFRML